MNSDDEEGSRDISHNTEGGGARGGPIFRKIPSCAAACTEHRSRFRLDRSGAPQLAQINFLVGHPGVAPGSQKPGIARRKAPRGDHSGLHTPTTTLSIKGCEREDGLLGQALHVIFMG